MKRLLRAIGAAAVLAGLAIGAVGGGSDLDVPYAVVVAIASGVLLLAFARLVGASAARGDAAHPPDTEAGYGVTVPGDDLDAEMGGFGSRVRRRLSHRVVVSLVRETGCDRATAEELVATGAWTNDPVAASYFTGDVAIPWRTRLRWWWNDSETRTERARRAVDALARLRAGRGVLADTNGSGTEPENRPTGEGSV